MYDSRYRHTTTTFRLDASSAVVDIRHQQSYRSVESRQHGKRRKNRCAAGYAGPVSTESSSIRRNAWLGNLGADSAGVSGRVVREPGFALSRASSPGASGLDCRGVGHFGVGAPRAILQAYAGRKATAPAGDRDVGPLRGGDRSSPRHGLI